MNFEEYIRLYADVKVNGDSDLTREEQLIAWASAVQAANDVLGDYKKAMELALKERGHSSLVSLVYDLQPLQKDIDAAEWELKPGQRRGL